MAGIFRCKGCTERYPGCHDHCKQYQEDKAANEKRKAEEYMRSQASAYTCMNILKVRNCQAVSKRDKAGMSYFRKGMW